MILLLNVLCVLLCGINCACTESTENNNRSDFSNTIKAINDKLSQLENENKILFKENRELKSKIKEIEDNISKDHKGKHANVNDHLPQTQNSFVGFTAYATEQASYDSGQTVIFDGVARNYGTAYNPELSVFQCPTAGYYLFSFTVYTEPEYRFEAEIYTNGEEGELVATHSAASIYNSASTVAITYCNLDQLVWIRCTWDNSKLYHANRISSFAGALLYSA